MTAARPASGAPIESSWGGQVHDQTFTPRGCIANSALITGIATTVVILPLTVGGPNLSGGAFVAPEAGVYAFDGVGVISAAGGASAFRVYAYLNGAQVPGTGYWEGAPVNGSGARASGLVTMAAGATLDFRCSGGSGTSGMTVTAYAWIRRVGDSLT